ncbi:LexA family protein [Pedobacter sp. AW1-32]|uniref:LexA family protein n=1 Tax=Pedobacter sp. AW1-32 TaxID=3383026 RepID=UPI003FEF31C6
MIRSFEKRAEQKISGFQSPASDYLEGRLDIAEKLVVDSHSTFYFKMEGEAMRSFGIDEGDILIVDRSLKVIHGAVVIAFIFGSLSCRMYVLVGKDMALRNDLGDILKKDMADVSIWGVVTAICRGMLPAGLKQGRYKDVCTL